MNQKLLFLLHIFFKVMSLESILMIVAPICVFTAGVLILPILVKPRKQNVLQKKYVRGL